MTGLWSMKEAAELFGLGETRLRYWAQTGFVGPSVRQKGRFYYTFQDLISVKTAIGLVDRGVPVQRVRKNLEALRRRLPEIDRPLSQLRICSDGDELVVIAEDAAFEPASGQLVLSFAVRQLSERLDELAPLPPVPAACSAPPANDAGSETAYACFVDGVAALDAADDLTAEKLFRRALALDGALAAAWTNIGNVLDRRGDRGAARDAYLQALAVDPDQPEARYNLANLHADAGELELAIAEYRRAGAAQGGSRSASRYTLLADADYNLALALHAAGRTDEARAAIERYLEHDDGSEWALRARQLLD